MNEEGFQEEWAKWLSTRPKVVQELGRKYPPGTILIGKGPDMHVVGYTEHGCLLVSHIAPKEDYVRAIKEAFHFNPERCAVCGGKLE